MDFRVLGDVEVAAEGAVRPLRRKESDLLALLLADPNRAVPADSLIERLWPTGAPASAATALRVHVSRLRAALRSPVVEVSRLVTSSTGYLVAVEPGELDADRFVQSVAIARELAESEPERAASILRAGLAEWRASPFANVDDDPTILARQRRTRAVPSGAPRAAGYC